MCAPDGHRARTRLMWAIEFVQMEAEGYFLNLIYSYFNIPLCLIKHIDVSSKNNENGSYCSLRGGKVTQGGSPRENLDRTKEAPWHGLGRA